MESVHVVSNLDLNMTLVTWTPLSLVNSLTCNKKTETKWMSYMENRVVQSGDFKRETGGCAQII